MLSCGFGKCDAKHDNAQCMPGPGVNTFEWEVVVGNSGISRLLPAKIRTNAHLIFLGLSKTHKAGPAIYYAYFLDAGRKRQRALRINRPPVTISFFYFHESPPEIAGY